MRTGKRCFMAALCIMMQVSPAFPAFAGTWKQDAGGWWYYLGSDGYMETSAMTPDGYAVGEDGAWIPGLGTEKDSPVSPWIYQSMLGKGMDVTWSELSRQNIIRI